MTELVKCWRGTSIKTRIETALRYTNTKSRLTVEEELPLKQGLKHAWTVGVSSKTLVEEELPLKQGLKLFLPFIIIFRIELKRNFH